MKTKKFIAIILCLSFVCFSMFSCGDTGTKVDTSSPFIDCPDCEDGHTHEDCLACQGEGEGECPTCKGETEVKCQICGGGGIIPCNDCNGFGVIICQDCKGSGTLPNGQKCTNCKEFELNGQIYLVEDCPTCTGKSDTPGCLSCEACEGDGKVDCTTCDATGKIDCEYCDGTGHGICFKCLGKGEIPNPNYKGNNDHA